MLPTYLLYPWGKAVERAGGAVNRLDDAGKVHAGVAPELIVDVTIQPEAAWNAKRVFRPSRWKTA